MLKRLLSLITLLVIISSMVFAQQAVTVTTQGFSPRDVVTDETGYVDIAYHGLDNVGIGTKVYLKGMGDLAFTAGTWTLTSKPAASAATMGTTFDVDTNVVYVTFIPDVAGKYVVTFADGEATTSITINAGTYLGLTDGNCVLCHSGYVEKWETTGHADMLVRGLDGTLSSYYNSGCITCHTVGNDPNDNANGFDDREFVFPAELTTGVFDTAVETYPDAMALANIQCESCHGPGYGHGGAASMDVTLSGDNCAWCHDSGTHHFRPEQWDHSGHDATEFDGRGFHGGHGIGAFVGYAGNRSSCAPCHSGSGFVQWVKEGRPINSDGLPTSIEFTPEATKHTCATCHDPHDNTNAHQLRSLDGTLGDGTEFSYEEYGTGAMCMNCHRSRRNGPEYSSDPGRASSHYGPHHGPQADMLLAANAPDFGFDLPSSPHAWATENTCVDCHMGGEHLDEEGNINLVGGHSWNMNDVEGNDHVEVCEPCHGNVGESFTEKKYYLNGNADFDGDGTAEGIQEEVHGLMHTLGMLLPPFDEDAVDVSGNDTTVVLTPEIMRAAYVWFWIEEDRSFGIHNPAFTVALLKAAIEEMGQPTGFDYPENEIPAEYKLSQNYPNPFNPTTKIKFAVPQASNVKITVYDVLGKEITRLVDTQMSAGSHEVEWNATNISSGIYFYRMEADNFVTIKKMLLMK